ncbi:chemotaxis protein CheB [Paraburkholderia sediminicola]|uniref:chemotaxis protein CheB n=1 Tax=Paraburkholderia sediminicola TaxID=458836 RepID=UPI0038BB5AC8
MSDIRLFEAGGSADVQLPVPVRAPHQAAVNFAVVGLGASAGGLDACRKLVDALPAATGMAYILVQHLDPDHESLMVELIADHTSMTVLQAVDGMRLEHEHLYIIPPGTYLAVRGGTLQLSTPEAPHGARLPFDFLLQSLAKEYGPRAVCVVLSGTGADGSIGLRAVKQAGGFVIAQDPDEAGYDGMPRNAIATGAVDRVLLAAAIPGALIQYDEQLSARLPEHLELQDIQPDAVSHGDTVNRIVKLLRSKTAYDFTLYKPGTLERRIERRMGMEGLDAGDMARYLDILESAPQECNLLAKDLLINVTRFFRDPKVYDFLSEVIVPDLISGHPVDQPLRIWTAGCSTGEETYSLTILFLEQIAAAGSNLKLQVFASDVDPDAIAGAREGHYPQAIEADVSQARLSRFFSKDEHGYRVLPELRAAVVFTVQDVLADPPFSRLDLVSCRNLLIYLRAEAQDKVISLFHFALREGGVLLLGNSETPGHVDGRFEVVSRSARVYRHIGHGRPGEFGFLTRIAGGTRRMVATGGRVDVEGKALSFSVEVQPVTSDGEQLLLICFVDAHRTAQKPGRAGEPQDLPRIAELEQELDATRAELQGAIRSLEMSSDEQKAINEEALSVNEEFQSTNEELLTSKEELQSLNEELTALNGQLQETLERQRTTSNDLQNVLYSTNLATLFLDSRLNIRFFTPATRTLFKLIPGDIGRPLSDLNSLASDDALLTDARTVLQSLVPIEREVESGGDVWFTRRILPYRTQDEEVAGVVITFTDITESKQSAKALELVTRQAEQANASKSRFLAAASHDLRQPLQTLTLLQGLLEKTVTSDKAHALLGRLDETLGAMSGMLNTLLDINQIEAGTVRAEIVSFRIGDLLERLKQEFAYPAQAQGLALHVVPCNLTICSDPRLLEQMIRNLLSNALKYTMHGKVLLGCRRREGSLSIEVWDSGVGIPKEDLQSVFQEYHQLDNPARERSRGLGLGLSIVQRLAGLLEHPLRVRSEPGRGSVFAIEVKLAPPGSPSQPEALPQGADPQPAEDLHRSGVILIVEDDPEVRDAMEMLLRDEGHHPVTAPDGVAALEWLAQETVRPDLVLADYNLPRGMDGLQMVAKVREKLHRELPAIILTGDISTETLRVVAQQNCEHLIKPVKFEDLAQVIQRLLTTSHAASHTAPLHPGESADASESPLAIFVVDDDSHVRGAIRSVLEDEGMRVEDFATCEGFLNAWRPGRRGCLILDANLPGMCGLELLNTLSKAGHALPTIMITGASDVQMVVQAVKAGASDFIEKPIGRTELLESIERAFEQSQDSGKLAAWRESAADHIASLTARQRQIMEMVLAGNPSKIIAANLAISQRTVENHRASIMKKTGSKSLPALARLALAASWTDAGERPVADEIA